MILGNKFYEHPDGYMVGLTSKGTEFFFDKEDLDLVQHFTWYVNGDRYLQTNDYSNGRQLILFHRMILHLEDPKIFVDHINHNTLDNMKSNLRVCSNRQNVRNSRIRTNNTSGFKGVHWHKSKNKWTARIMVEGNNKHLGYFDDKHNGALAYNEAALKYHGEFAKLNDV